MNKEFVLNRNFTLVSDLGHVIRFEKDVPVSVPRALWNKALEIGAAPVGESAGDVATTLAAETAARARLGEGPQDAEERRAQIYAAFDLLIETNDSNDFTASGAPKDKALEKILGWNVDSKEKIKLWNEYREAKASE